MVVKRGYTVLTFGDSFIPYIYKHKSSQVLFLLRVQRGEGRRKAKRRKTKQWTKNLMNPFGKICKSERKFISKLKRKFISKLTRMHVRQWSGLVRQSVLREFAPRNNLLKVQR